MISIHIAIDCRTLVSRLKGIYGSAYGQTRFQGFLRGFTPMFVVICLSYIAKLVS